MSDWMSLTKKESKSTWQEKIEDAEKGIIAMLNGRCGRVRRKGSPF